jgi:hypothetical protein
VTYGAVGELAGDAEGTLTAAEDRPDPRYVVLLGFEVTASHTQNRQPMMMKKPNFVLRICARKLPIPDAALR